METTKDNVYPGRYLMRQTGKPEQIVRVFDVGGVLWVNFESGKTVKHKDLKGAEFTRIE